MIDIKFRGKPFEDIDFDYINVHISKKDFVYGSLIVDGKDCFIVNGVVFCNEDNIQLEQWIPVIPETVGQFTGLTDKNGVEIYDGDIYEHGDSVMTVVWVDYGFAAQDNNTKELWYLNKHHQQYYKVIGNIHEGGKA